MSEAKPNGPYIFQPFGTAANKNPDRPEGLYAIGGMPLGVTVSGFTKAEAEQLLPVCRKIHTEAAS